MEQKKHYIEIHLAVLLFGGAGLFGKLIGISAGGIVLGRAFVAAMFILLVGSLFGEKFKPRSAKDTGVFVLLGAILAFHWVAFFQSIQLSSVAIGVLTFSTFPIFTILLEPLVFKEKFQIKNLLLALVALVGIVLVMPSMEMANPNTQGALWGIASGASFAVLALINKQMLSGYSGNAVSFYQNGVAALVLMPFFYQSVLGANAMDVFYLLVLGVVFTGIAHTLFIRSMKGLKAQTASLITTLEPVYAILCAWMFLGEIPTIQMMFGGVLILGVAFFSFEF